VFKKKSEELQNIIEMGIKKKPKTVYELRDFTAILLEVQCFPFPLFQNALLLMFSNGPYPHEVHLYLKNVLPRQWINSATESPDLTL
jgi:hypothetical protein